MAIKNYEEIMREIKKAKEVAEGVEGLPGDLKSLENAIDTLSQPGIKNAEDAKKAVQVITDLMGVISGKMNLPVLQGLIDESIGNFSESINKTIDRIEEHKSLLERIMDMLFGPDSTPSTDDAERTRSPLVIDLNGDGVKTINLKEGISFDFDKNSFAEKTAWIDQNDGLLALDLNGNDKIDSGSELFGNYTPLKDGTLAADGFAALRQYDTNADGVISAQDAIWSQLKVWQDRNYNGKTDADELSSLSDLGIASINLQAQQVHEIDDANNDISHRSQITWTDGTQSDIEDVWFKVNTADSRYTGAVDIPEDVAVLPNVHGFGNVPDLQIAMSKDSKLKAMVEEYIAADETKRDALLDALIYRWTGSEDVDPYSRDPKKIYGHVMDGGCSKFCVKVNFTV